MYGLKYDVLTAIKIGFQHLSTEIWSRRQCYQIEQQKEFQKIWSQEHVGGEFFAVDEKRPVGNGSSRLPHFSLLPMKGLQVWERSLNAHSVSSLSPIYRATLSSHLLPAFCQPLPSSLFSL